MKPQTIRRNFLLLIMVICFLTSGVFGLTGCSKKASQFTEEEHIQRITKRIQARYIDGDEKLRYEDTPTGFNVYPLYNENDELKYFLVEFEPYGFLYVKINYNLGSVGMYSLTVNTSGELPWSRYTIDETKSQPLPDTDICWEVDENGEKIIYNRSQYSVTGIEGEKLYLLSESGMEGANKIPALKRDGQYLNLISMEMVDSGLSGKQAVAYIYFIPKKHFNL